jgi:ketosteroid isomerase-like protein
MIIRTLLIATGAMLLSACQPESSDDAATIAAAKAGYDAFATGDMDAWAKTQAADAKWTMPKGFPYAGVYYGPEQVIEEVFAPIGALWPDFKVEPVAFHASGNVVFVETKMTTGGQTSDSIHKVVITDGVYTEFQVYDDAGFMMAHTSGADGIGTQFFDDGSSKSLRAGDAASVQIWVDYIQAHNDRDFEKIAAMNADDFKGIAASGEVVEGSAAHTAFLEKWIAAESPQWQVWWVIANDGENAEGKMEQWLATGNVVTTTDPDGAERRTYETVDVLLEGGKIKLLNVAAQSMPQ